MPNELLEPIARSIQHLPSLSALARTSFRLFENVSPILYHTMHLRHPNQLMPFSAQVGRLPFSLRHPDHMLIGACFFAVGSALRNG
jgi:hypothetical protein